MDLSNEYQRAWLGLDGGIISTMDDLNQFFRALMGGELLPPAQLAQMKDTVATDARFDPGTRYGLGLTLKPIGSCGSFWGHNGGTGGASTDAFISDDGRRQFAIARNKTSHGPANKLEKDRRAASATFMKVAACGTPV